MAIRHLKCVTIVRYLSPCHTKRRWHSVCTAFWKPVSALWTTPENIKFASYSVYTTSSQRPYSVHTTFPRRLYSVHDASTARKQLFTYLLFWTTLFCKHSDLFLLFEAIRQIIQQLFKCLKSSRTCNICSVHWIAFLMMCLSLGLFLLNNLLLK